ncbi:MAG: ARMT1-like domain-containing protein [Candidatus Neomarinimicrobiota bacterium]
MKTYLDCIPCFVQQALDAARRVSTNPAVQEQLVRDVLRRIGEMSMSDPPPVMGQYFHRRLREITGQRDPYQAEKEKQNRLAMDLLPNLKAKIESAGDPLALAVRLAIAGNIIDLGANGRLTVSDILRSVHHALTEPLAGDWEGFRLAIAKARNILYLADNAGEIAFDRLLIEQISPKRVTVVVRGVPVINDATIVDAHAVGLNEIIEIIDNGSDAPGTVLTDCSREFNRRFADADLILAKGQGNFETLSDEPRNIFFLFKVKCPVIATHIGQPVGTQVFMKSNAEPFKSEDV